MSKILIFNYNNYYNRIIKKENTIGAYKTAGSLVYNNGDNVTNFNPNDGVTTSLIIGTKIADGTGYGGNGDYVLVVDDQHAQDTDAPVSRWFIIEHERTRQGQFNLTLKRDIIADYYDQVIVAPMIVNRAMIDDINNNLLYNSEGFDLNQIKKGEVKLTQRAHNEGTYYALYFAKSAAGAGVPEGESFPNISGTIQLSTIPYDKSIATPIADSLYKAATYTNLGGCRMQLMWRPDTHWYSLKNSPYYKTVLAPTGDVYTGGPYDLWVGNTGLTPNEQLWIVEKYEDAEGPLSRAMKNAWDNNHDIVKNAIATEQSIDTTHPISLSDMTELLNFNGKIIKDSDNKYWKVYTTRLNQDFNYFSPVNSAVQTLAASMVTASGLEVWGAFGNEATQYWYNLQTISVRLEEIPVSNTLSYNINFSTHYSTNAPYNVVLIPANTQRARIDLYSEIEGGVITLSQKFRANEDINRKILDQIMLKAGKWLLDVQLIPYIPINDLMMWGENGIYIDGDYDNPIMNPPHPHFYQSSVGTVENNPCWWCYYVDEISYEFTILNNDYSHQSQGAPLNLWINDNWPPTELDYKIENECRIMRLTAPNYNGSFDFNLAKNRGLYGIKAQITLRPYNPYFHLCPWFDGVYGYDYNDGRGLICQGDFSIPIITDQFKNYEIDNKNYQQMFNRNIEHMDFQHGQERVQTWTNAIVGTLTGAAAGMGAGAGISKLSGATGPAGMIAGGIVGGLASAVGGAVDVGLMYGRQREDKDYMIDSFNLQIGNVKALPTTINKITPFTNNNKVYPVLEVYECSEQEKQMVMDYIQYKSMRVGAIGNINLYKKTDRTFIQGTLIRLENTSLGGNEVNAINNELEKGVYI